MTDREKTKRLSWKVFIHDNCPTKHSHRSDVVRADSENDAVAQGSNPFGIDVFVLAKLGTDGRLRAFLWFSAGILSALMFTNWVLC